MCTLFLSMHKMDCFLDLCMSSLRKSHDVLLCIVPSLDFAPKSEGLTQRASTPNGASRCAFLGGCTQ